jgi:hypothetical protein
LLGDFTAQMDGFTIALHRREIESFVCTDEADRNIAAGRLRHAELHEYVGRGRSFTGRRYIAVQDLEADMVIPLFTPALIIRSPQTAGY